MMAPPPPPGWWKRNWKWFVPVTLFGLLLLGVVAIGLIVMFVMGAVKSSVPYTQALTQAKTNPALLEEMGAPIEAGWYVTGSISSSGSGSNANLSFPIYGPKKSGMLHVVATKNPFSAVTGEWRFTELEANVEGRNEPISLMNDYDPKSRLTLTPPANDYVIPPPPPAPGKKPDAISAGVLNNRATSLPEPEYPPIAKAGKLGGAVAVQVTVDVNGKVISANAVSGHPLLRAAAVQAAYRARFLPAIVGGEHVKVTGVVNYNFSIQ
jgi:TonB family protein